MHVISTAKFLDAVLPKGIRYIGYTNGMVGPSGRPIIACSAFEDAEQGIAIGNRKQDQDVYFALASFKVAKVYDEAKGYMKSYRHQENVAKLKSIWLDIDFKNYDSPEQTVHEFKAFLDNNIPDPTFIVNSGGGLHVYWVFEEELNPEEWSVLSHGLAGLAKRLGLRADLGVTIDSARVLRLPGTLNQKYDNKPMCKVAKMGSYASRERMHELLASHSYTVGGVQNPNLKVPDNIVHLYDPALNKDLSEGYDASNLSFASRIVERCPTMKNTLETHGAEDGYPMWKDVLHLLAFAEDGEDYIHEVSKGYAGYSEAETKARYEESLIVKADGRRGPTTCERFSAHPNSKCATCKFRGHIKTPWSLGVTYEVDKEPTYVVGEKTFIAKTRVNPETGETEQHEVLVCKYALEDWDIIPVLSSTGEPPQLWLTAKSKQKTCKLKLPLTRFADLKQLNSHMLKDGIGLQEKELKVFREAAVAWIKHLTERQNMLEVDSFGWTKKRDGFVIGEEIIYKDGTEKKVISDAIVSQDYLVSGSPEPWEELAGLLVEDEHPAFSMLLAAGFASPIMQFGTPLSIALSVCSRESGVGKSTALRTIQGAFGEPRKMFTLDDTQNYIIRRSGMLRDLPTLWDEIRGHDVARDLTQTLFRMTQGRTKGRLSQSAELKATYDLNTMMICATNTPIADFVQSAVKGTDAGMMRFLEFNLDRRPNTENKHKIHALLGKLERNHGHAGRKYIRWLLQNTEMIDQAMSQLEPIIDEKAQFTVAERFWRDAVVKITTAAVLMRLSGVLKIDHRKVMDFAIEVVRRQRLMVEEQKTEDVDVVNTVVNQFANEMLITDVLAPKKKGRQRTLRSVNVRRTPHGGSRKVKLQVSIKDKKLLLPFPVLREFCDMHDFSFTNIRRRLEEERNVEIERMTLGAGTQYAQGQARVFVVDVADMSDITDAWPLDSDSSSTSSQPATLDS